MNKDLFMTPKEASAMSGGRYTQITIHNLIKQDMVNIDEGGFAEYTIGRTGRYRYIIYKKAYMDWLERRGIVPLEVG